MGGGRALFQEADHREEDFIVSWGGRSMSYPIPLLCPTFCASWTVYGRLLLWVGLPTPWTDISETVSQQKPSLPRVMSAIPSQRHKKQLLWALGIQTVLMAPITQHKHVLVYRASSEVNGTRSLWKGLAKSFRCCLSSDSWTHFGAEQGLCISRFFSDFLQPLPSGPLQD